MKKIILIALVFLTSFGLNNSFGQTTLAHVNTQAVLDTMPSRKQAQKEIVNFRERALKELQETQQNLQENYAKLQNKKEEMSPTAFKFEQQRLMKKSKDFQTRQQELDQQMQKLSQELNAPILKEVQDAVKKVAKANNIDYVIDQSSLLYSNGQDITDMVIKEVLKIESKESEAKTPIAE